MTSTYIPRLPISVNSAYYFIRMGKRTIKRKRKEAFNFIAQALECFWEQNPEHIMYDRDKKLVVTLTFMISDNRKHDIDNLQKLILDCFSESHVMDLNKRGYDFKPVWNDDNQIQLLISSKIKHIVNGTIVDIEEVKK